MAIVRERLERLEAAPAGADYAAAQEAMAAGKIEFYNVGFTGTRDGTTKEQRGTLRKLMALLREDQKQIFFRHGDCIGADESAHSLALQLDYAVIIHPPEDESLRAFCKGAFSVLPARPYLERNLRIVEKSHILLACPKGINEEKRGSGTWSTIRVAIKARCPVRVIFPDGSFDRGK